MKLYLEDENGNRTRVEKLSGIGEGDIVIRLETFMRESDIKRMETNLSEKLNRKVIVLDARVEEILIVPPKKQN